MNIFNFTLSNIVETPLRKINDDDNEENLRLRLNIPNWNIYLLAKVPKILFVNLDQVEINNEKISFQYEFKKEVYSVNTTLNQLYQHFNFGLPKELIETNSYSIKHKKNESTDKEIAIQVNGGNGFETTIYHTAELLDEYLNIKPETLYIGESKNILKRMKSHSTLQKILMEKNDNEDIRVYFLSFDYGVGTQIGGEFESELSDKSIDIILTNSASDDKKRKNKMQLLERLLIYFYKPEYNDKHKKTSPENDNLINEMLIAEKINGIVLNMGNYIQSFQFWSKKQSVKSNVVSYLFNTDFKFKKGITFKKQNQ